MTVSDRCPPCSGKLIKPAQSLVSRETLRKRLILFNRKLDGLYSLNRPRFQLLIALKNRQSSINLFRLHWIVCIYNENHQETVTQSYNVRKSYAKLILPNLCALRKDLQQLVFNCVARKLISLVAVRLFVFYAARKYNESAIDLK